MHTREKMTSVDVRTMKIASTDEVAALKSGDRIHVAGYPEFEDNIKMSNGYTYSSNNPIILTDPQGTQDTGPDVSVPASTGGGGGFFGFTFKEKILSCVSRITNKNDIHHILLKHHKWNTISSGKWNDVQHIISWAMKNGTRKKLSKNVYRRIATHPEYNITIEVRYTYVKGKIRISDAWVVK